MFLKFVDSEILNMKQKIKDQGSVLSGSELLKDILEKKNYKPEYLVNSLSLIKVTEEDNYFQIKKESPKPTKIVKQKKHLLPSFESICERPAKK